MKPSYSRLISLMPNKKNYQTLTQLSILLMLFGCDHGTAQIHLSLIAHFECFTFNHKSTVCAGGYFPNCIFSLIEKYQIKSRDDCGH